MLRMSVEKVINVTNASVVVAGSKDVAGEVVIDSREVAAGGVFVAFRGERSDGNAYLAQAARSGASVVVASAEPAEEACAAARACDCTLVRAENDDCEEFLLRLAHAWRLEHPSWIVIGVTGSVGKTTTKDMLRTAISSQRRCHATSGNFNNLIGLPLTVLSAPDDAEVLVCELGMNHPHEIGRMSACCEPTLALVTNVGTSHIGLLGSREGIARAKAEIVSGMHAVGNLGPTLVLRSADDFTPLIAEEYARPVGVEVKTVGNAEGDMMSASDCKLGDDGHVSVTLSSRDGWSARSRLPVPGERAVDDLLLAMAMVSELGLDRDLALAAVERMPATHMRLEVSTSPSGIQVIDDSYNAAPASMASALDVLSSMACDGRRVAMLGEMGELGEHARRLHGYVGAYAAAKGLDLLVFVGGSLADEMAEAARTMGMSEDAIERFDDAETAGDVLLEVLAPHDVVLAKGSRAVGLDVVVRKVLSR